MEQISTNAKTQNDSQKRFDIADFSASFQETKRAIEELLKNGKRFDATSQLNSR